MISQAAARLRQWLPAWPAARAIDRRNLASPLDRGGRRNTGAAMAVYWGADRIAQARADRARFHLGRGRRAREVGHHEQAAQDARRALVQQPLDPWAHALLGQAVLRQRQPNLGGARRALEQACALSPRNGYFVGLLREVLQAQGDVDARRRMTDRAWWLGAPVERWLEGRPGRQVDPAAATPDAAAPPAVRVAVRASA